MHTMKRPKVRQITGCSFLVTTRGTEIDLMDHLAQSNQDLSGHYAVTTACLLFTLAPIPAVSLCTVPRAHRAAKAARGYATRHSYI